MQPKVLGNVRLIVLYDVGVGYQYLLERFVS